MTERDFENFANAMAGLGEMYNRAVSAQLIAMYFESLKKYDYRAVSAAMQRHYSDPEKGAFFPKPGDIVLWIDGGMEDRSQIAWSKVDRAVRVVGPYESVVFDDPIIHAVIEQMGGWPKVCSQPTDQDMKFLGHQFTKLYRANRSTKEFPSRLVGITEADCNLRGSRPPAAVLIGNPEQAGLVIEHGGESNRLAISRNHSAANHSQIENLITQQPRKISEVA